MFPKEKVVIVGNELTSDILFGNLNGMLTAWTSFKHVNDAFRV